MKELQSRPLSRLITLSHTDNNIHHKRMKSPTLPLFIGCITLFFPNHVALGRLFPLNVWRPPPTISPTSKPSYQPSLRPSLQPSLAPSINPVSASTISQNYMLTSSDGTSSSPFFRDWWWIAPLSAILVLFIGVLFCMDSKRKRSTVPSVESKTDESEEEGTVPELSGKNGWVGWITWPSSSWFL